MSFDILLGPDRDIPQNTRLVSGMEIVAQRIDIRLRTFLGEWILDTTVGLPFLDWTQQKPPNVPVMVAFIRREIETTPGVRQVITLTGDFDITTRRITFTGSIVVEDEEESLDVIISPLGLEEGNTTPFISFLTKSGPILAGI